MSSSEQMRRVILIGSLLSAGLLAGCATYRALPLPVGPDLSASLSLEVPSSEFAHTRRNQPQWDTTKGLDATEIMTLAVVNNPELKAARLREGLASAQLLEAGLLPDPRIGASVEQSSTLTGYSVGLSEDIRSLLTRGAKVKAARSHVRQVNLAVTWMEFQVAEKARELFIEIVANEQLGRVLGRMRSLQAARVEAEQREVARGALSADESSLQLAALNGIDVRRSRLSLNEEAARHALAEMLGLRPDARLRLAPGSEAASLSAAQLKTAMSGLPRHRADLLALQAGYESQEQSLREAVLAQFPAISVGIQKGRSADGGVRTVGLGVDLTLPLFNRNSGRIAVERATRAALRQEYQSRLDAAVSEADEVWEAGRLTERQLSGLEARLGNLRKASDAARKSFERGELSWGRYASLRAAELETEMEALRLKETLARDQSALTLLLGLPLDGWSPPGPKR